MMSDRGFRYSLRKPQARPVDDWSSSPDGIMRIDPQTGFKYRKPILLERPDFEYTPTSSQVAPIVSSSPLRHRYTFDDSSSFNTSEILLYDTTQSTSSSSSSSSSNSAMTLNASRPPLHVPTSDYYKYTPLGLSPMQRTTQILIWIAEKSLVDDDVAAANRGQSFDRATGIVRETKLKLIQKLRNHGAGFSVFNRPDNEDPPEPKENPVNVANAEKLVELRNSNKILQDEIHDWKDVSGKVYQLHAESKDTIREKTRMTYADIDIDSMVEDLDDTQRDFYHQYCNNSDDEEEENISEKFREIIDPGVTQMRQALNTANQFTLETHHYTKGRLSILAKSVTDSSRIIPTEYDYTVPGVFDNDERKKESELKSLHLMLRLSTRNPQNK